MARNGRGGANPTTPAAARRGSVHPCMPYAGEIARHRVLTADGQDFAVATTTPCGRESSFVTAAYPVQHGYLVMMRQPLCVLRSADGGAARAEHEALVRVLAEAGVGVVRARRALAARRRAEHAAAQDTAQDAPAAAVALSEQANQAAVVAV